MSRLFPHAVLMSYRHAGGVCEVDGGQVCPSRCRRRVEGVPALTLKIPAYVPGLVILLFRRICRCRSYLALVGIVACPGSGPGQVEALGVDGAAARGDGNAAPRIGHVDRRADLPCSAIECYLSGLQTVSYRRVIRQAVGRDDFPGSFLDNESAVSRKRLRRRSSRPRRMCLNRALSDLPVRGSRLERRCSQLLRLRIPACRSCRRPR